MLYPFKQPSTRFRCTSAPLLEKEVHSFLLAEFSNVENPAQLHGTGFGSAFPTDYNPRDSFKIYVSYGTEKRLDGNEANRDRRLLKMLYPGDRHSVLYRYSTPNMLWSKARPISTPQVIPHKGASFCEYLEYVPVSLFHSFENTIDKIRRDVLVE